MDVSEDIARAAADFIAFNSSVAVIPSAAKMPTRDIREEVQRESQMISEFMFMESAKVVAASQGVDIRTMNDLSHFMRSNMISRAVGDGRKRRQDDTTPAAPSSPYQHVRSRDDVYSFRTRKERIAAIASRLSDGLELARTPLATGGEIADIVQIRCAVGHTHPTHVDYVLEKGLSECHTCKCTDLIINAVRTFMEGVTGYPFTLEGRTTLQSAAARIIVHIGGRDCKLRRDGKTIMISVPYVADAALRISAKMTKSSVTTADGRAVCDLVTKYKPTVVETPTYVPVVRMDPPRTRRAPPPPTVAPETVLQTPPAVLFGGHGKLRHTASAIFD